MTECPFRGERKYEYRGAEVGGEFDESEISRYNARAVSAVAIADNVRSTVAGGLFA